MKAKFKRIDEAVGMPIEEIKGIPISNDFDTELDLAKFMGIVHSKIKSNVSSDFVLSRPDPKDREFMIEMMNNAYFVNNMMRGLMMAAEMRLFERKVFRPQDTFMLRELEKQIELLKKSKEMVFISFTSKSQLLAIMTRNVPENHLAKILAKIKDEPELPIQEEPGIIEKAKGLLRPQDKG